MTDVDFIVVGQGLAGSILALQLIEQGYTVKVIDKPELSSCSKVAAGIWNPVVFKRLTKSWMIDALLPELLQFYKQSEKLFDTALITERHIVKLFSEQQEAELWKNKSANEVENYLDKAIYFNSNFKGIKSLPFGYSKVLGAGNLDVKKFLKLTQQFLQQKGCLITETFNYSDLLISDSVSYKNIKAKNIVFADGYLIKANPYFNYIPFKPAKGEVLTIESEHIDIDDNIINKNAFLLRLENNTFKLGATYDWNNLNEKPSESAALELQSRFYKIAEAEFKIVNHEAGVRPSVIDRRPIIGHHPAHKNLFIFNGLGTKGVMLAPYFAKKLVRYIKFNELIPDEVNVSRFPINR